MVLKILSPLPDQAAFLGSRISDDPALLGEPVQALEYIHKQLPNARLDPYGAGDNRAGQALLAGLNPPGERGRGRGRPNCQEEVDPEALRLFMQRPIQERRIRHQRRFCDQHRMLSAEREWESRATRLLTGIASTSQSVSTSRPSTKYLCLGRVVL